MAGKSALKPRYDLSFRVFLILYTPIGRLASLYAFFATDFSIRLPHSSFSPAFEFRECRGRARRSTEAIVYARSISILVGDSDYAVRSLFPSLSEFSNVGSRGHGPSPGKNPTYYRYQDI